MLGLASHRYAAVLTDLVQSFRPGHAALAFALSLLSLGVRALAWGSTQNAFDRRTRLGLRQTFYIFLAGHLGRYIPGKVFGLMGRVVLLEKRSQKAVLLSSVLDQLLTLVAGALFGVGFLAWWLAGVGWGVLGVVAPTLLVAFVLARVGLPRRVINWVLPSSSIEGEPLPFDNGRIVARMYCAAVVSLLLSGLSLYFLQRAASMPLGPVSISSLLPVTLSYATAGAVGMLAWIAPAGLGVREAVLGWLLSPVWGAQEAIAIAIAFRALQFIVELVLFLVTLVTQRVPTVQLQVKTA